ncbi:MAG: hypothetical protein QM775_05310 [Pirellulales bacterium]
MHETLTPKRLIADSLRHHRRIHIAVALGTAAATAVLTGALLVGDSVRGSLKHTALDRLGAIDDVLVSQNLFREQLADELDDAGPTPKPYVVAAPGLYLAGSATHPTNKSRAANVNILGFTDEFRQAFYPRDGESYEVKSPRDDEIVLNETLANELAANIGDDIILRLPTARDVPEESPLGRQDRHGREFATAQGRADHSRHWPRRIFTAAQPASAEERLRVTFGDAENLGQTEYRECRLRSRPGIFPDR